MKNFFLVAKLCKSEQSSSGYRAVMSTGEEDFQRILESGISFGRGGERKDPNEGKVKTKAKKKQYITGAHGSGSARQKAKYREQRANRKHR